MLSGYFVYILARFHGASINFRDIFGIIATFKSFCFFMAEHLSHSFKTSLEFQINESRLIYLRLPNSKSWV